MYDKLEYYWFYSLRYDKVVHAENMIDEYCYLNCPQEYDGPFNTEEEAIAYQKANPHLTIEFNEFLEEYQRLIEEEIQDEEMNRFLEEYYIHLEEERAWEDALNELG
jgi:hypothetical protein